MWDSLRLKCEELGLNKVLVSYHVTGHLDTFEIFEISEHISNTYRYCPKIAFSDKNLENSEQNLFGETVLSNRGAIGKAFQETRRAEEWLSSQ